jgi:hypothetical protein
VSNRIEYANNVNERNDYNGVTDIFRYRAYNSAMPANELNRDNHEFTHNGHDYWIYTFMTRGGLLCYRTWRKIDDGQAKPGEAREDLIQRLKTKLIELETSPKAQ